MRLLIGVCKTAGGASVINMCSVVTRKVRRKEFEIKGEKTEGKKRRKKMYQESRNRTLNQTDDRRQRTLLGQETLHTFSLIKICRKRAFGERLHIPQPNH